MSTAYLERDSRYYPEAVQTVAKRSGNGYLLTGRKSLVWHGEVADALLVTARIADGDGIGLFVVPRATKG